MPAYELLEGGSAFCNQAATLEMSVSPVPGTNWWLVHNSVVEPWFIFIMSLLGMCELGG